MQKRAREQRCERNNVVLCIIAKNGGADEERKFKCIYLFTATKNPVRKEKKIAVENEQKNIKQDALF